MTVTHNSDLVTVRIEHTSPWSLVGEAATTKVPAWARRGTIRANTEIAGVRLAFGRL